MFQTLKSISLASATLLTATADSIAEDRRAECTDDAMLVFDGSGSMAAISHNGLKSPRIVEAREAIHVSMPQISPFRKLGLLIFGPGPVDTCNNIDLRFTPQSNAGPRIIADVDSLNPIGQTPLTESVEKAIDALDTTDAPGVVVLLTDGRESCGRDPCALAAEIAAEKNVTVHVIGFKVRAQHFQWNGQGAKNRETSARCLADRTGGIYVSAETTDELIKALQDTLSCPMTAMGGRREAQDVPG